MEGRETETRSLKMKSRAIPALAILLVLVQLLSPAKGWMMLLSGLGGAWLVSYLWARSLKRGLRLEREMRFGWMSVGDQVQERIVVANHGWAPGLWVRIRDHSDMHDYDISSVRDFSQGRYRHWFSRGVCTQRGLYTMGPTLIEASDPLGLYHVSVEYPETTTMMVAPPVINLPQIEIAAGGRIGEGKTHVRGLDQTVAAGGVRSYVQGDSLRWIHWPTTAKENEPYVQIFDSEPSSDSWVLLDMDESIQVGEGQRSTEEYGVILAASLVNRCVMEDKAVGFVSHGEETLWHAPALGNSHLWKILRSLAGAKPGSIALGQLLESIQGSIDRQSSLVIVTANASSDWLPALDILRRFDIVPTVILLDSASFGGSGSIATLRSQLIRMNIAHYIITADLLEPVAESGDKPWDWLLFPTAPGRSSHDGRSRIWRWITRSIRTIGLVTLLLWGMVGTLGEAIPGIDESFLWFMAAGGVILNGLLMIPRLPHWIIGLLSSVLGIVISTIRVGRLESLLIETGSELLSFIGQSLQALFTSAAAPGREALQASLATLGDSLGLLSVRLWEWASGILQGEPFMDPVAVAVMWGIAAWIAAGWAMYGVLKLKDPAIGAVPAFALVAAASGVTRQPPYVLAAMLGAMILLRVFVRYDEHVREWEDVRLHYENTISPRIAAAGIVLSTALMVFATLVPSISLRDIRDYIEELTGKEQSGDIASSLGLSARGEPEEINALDASNTESLPNRHLLGSGPELSERLVMRVGLEIWPGGGIHVEGVAPPSFIYLRSLTFDRYTGAGWVSEYENIVDYGAGDLFVTTWPDHYYQIRQAIGFMGDADGLLYVVGTPVRADRDASIAWRTVAEESEEVDFYGGMISASAYRADSVLPILSERELREAGQSYPEWIAARYLSLPPDVPDDVLSLARDLTAVGRTPYDRVMALEEHLRELDYSLDVSLAPAGKDVTQHFLFTLQEGYCDYFATAFVVLSRAAGIPARMVTGYIGELTDAASATYTVSEAQAHAWAEVYFPDYGWIPFEPTSNRAEMERPVEPLPTIPEADPLTMTSLDEGPGLPPLVWVARVLVALLILLGGFAAAVGLSDLYLRRLPAASLVPKVYRRTLRLALWVGIPLQLHHTPYDVLGFVDRWLEVLGRTSRWQDWLMQASEDIGVVVEAMVLHLFSEQGSSGLDTRRIAQSYFRLRPRFWMLWLLSRARTYPLFWSLIWHIPPPLTITIDG